MVKPRGYISGVPELTYVGSLTDAISTNQSG